MNSTPLWRRIVGLPSERLGWIAVAMALGVFAFYGVLLAIVKMGYKGGATFWSNPPLAVTVLCLLGSGIGGGIVAALSIARRGERSILVWAALGWGLLVLIFALGEIGGH